LLVVFQVTFAMLTGRGIGSGGLISLFILTFFFSKLLDQADTEDSAATITHQISLIYIIHVVFILAELGARLAGHTETLVAIAGHATEVTKYKAYNSANFLNYLGIEDISGMNSLLLGSQSASQLVLFSIFWFAPLYKGYALATSKWFFVFWFVFSAMLFPFVVSMTAMALLLVLTLFLIYVLPNSSLNRPVTWIATPVIAISFSSILSPLFTYRIKNEKDIEIYITSFMDAPLNFMELPLLDKVMGFGRNVYESPIQAADFGLAMITYHAGLLLVGLALICLALIIITACRRIRQADMMGFVRSPWALLAGANVVCATGWAASLIHYTPALELGGRQLFALHLAACLVSLKRLSRACRLRRQAGFQSNEFSTLAGSSQ
jgi:hypothetical protein